MNVSLVVGLVLEVVTEKLVGWRLESQDSVTRFFVKEQWPSVVLRRL